MLPSPQFSSLPVRVGVSAFSLWKIFVSPGTVGGILLPSLWLLCTFPARVAAGWEQRWCSGRSCPHPRHSRASPLELGNGASPSISSARSLRMAARISLRSSYSPAARSCKREARKEAGSALAQVPSQQTVCPGTQSLTSFVSSSTLVMASSCSDKAVRAACCSSSRCRDLSRVESSGRLGAVMGACEQSPLVGRWQIQATGPTRSKAALCQAAPNSYSLKSVPDTVEPGTAALICQGRGRDNLSSQQDSLWPILLVVLSVAAAFWAEALGCQCLLVPLQLLPLQLPDS